ncbi:MAG: O-antigen ligase family protein [Candidatus Margulisbacteria bacterium]|nr:O-antigen ligase family protein [Candidatus Margulisiibacteriota bacterium]
MKKNRPALKTAPTEKRSRLAGFLTYDLVIEIMLLVIVFLIPIIFDRRLGIVFSGTKVAWLRAFVIVTLGVWAIKLIVTKEHRFIRTVLDWPILAYLLITTVATLTSVHVYTSFVGFYGRFEGLSTWYLFGLSFFIVTNYIFSFEQLKRIIVAVVSSATIMSVYGVIQRQELDPYMWGGVVTWQRVIGTIGQPNFLAAYILMAFFLGLVLFLEEKKAAPEIDWFEQLTPLGYFLFSQVGFVFMIYFLDASDVFLWYSGFAIITAGTLLFAFNYQKLHPLILDLLFGSCLILIYICLLYTQSRGGYMGFFTGGVLFVLVAGRHWIFKSWKELALLGLFIVIISAFTMLRPEYSPFERFTGEISTKTEIKSAGEEAAQLELKGAAGSRGETWKSGFRIVADNPLFGIGPEVLKMVFPRYETELFRFKETFHVKQDRNHNETLDVPVTKGLISFFLYLGILFTVFRTGFVKLKTATDPQRLMIAGLLAASLAYLVQNQFSFGVVAITSLFWIMWAMVMILGQGEEAGPKAAKISLNDIPWLPVAGVILAGTFLIWISFFSFFSDVYFKSGKTNLDAGHLTQAVDDLTRSLNVFPLEGTTVSHLAIAYLNQGKNDEAARDLIYGTLIDPYNADNFYMLSRLYLSLYDRGKKEALLESERNADIALKIDPYYAEAYETKAMIDERLGKPDEALALYEKAFIINPTLVSVILKTEELSKKLGKVGEARQIFADAYQRFPDNIELFKVLERLK